MLVGIDHLAVQGGVYLGLLRVLLVLFIGSLVLKHLVALLQVAVLDVEHQSGGVVALQREHHPQAVAQVVMRQTVAQWLLALLLTAHDASGELHALRVVEDESCLVGLEVVGRQRVGVVVILMVESVAPEGVSVLHRLDAGIARQHAEGELAFVVGLHLAGSGAHLMTIDQERHALHRDAGAFILHITGYLDARTHFYHHILQHVLAWGGAEGDGGSLHTVQGGGQLVFGFLLVLVGQSLEAEEAALVGHGGHFLIVHRHDDLLTRDACAVEEAEIALHGGELLTHTLHFLRLVEVDALAVGHAAHLIDILVYGRGFLVFILRVAELGGDGFFAKVSILLVLAPHLVIIHRFLGLVRPGQHRRGGQCAHLQ